MNKKPYKQVSWVCPYCDTKIGGEGFLMNSIKFDGSDGHRFGGCKCGKWETEHDLPYTGEGSILDQEVPFVIYTPNPGKRRVEPTKEKGE